MVEISILQDLEMKLESSQMAVLQFCYVMQSSIELSFNVYTEFQRY